MSSPVMLRSRDPRPVHHGRADPIAALVVLLLGLVAIGLLGAGAFATYDWTTPAGQGTVVGVLAALFAIALVTLILAEGVRAARRADRR
jgi:hypothetical protein